MLLLPFGLAFAMSLAEGIAAVHRSWGNDARLNLESTPQSVTTPDPSLGYTPNPGTQVLAIRTSGDSTLYRVTYTITNAGARRTRGNVQGDTWLFMGCSFTFGDGVEDDETLPSRFSEQLGWTANVVNLGVSGYGAHQVLRQLETERLAGAAAPVKHVIYQALPAHVARTAGRFQWGFGGPAYRVSGDSLRYDGPHHSTNVIRILRLARRSDLMSLLLERLYYRRESTSEEIEVYARVVEKAAALAKEKLGADFTVLFWDTDSPTTERVFDRLAATGVPIVRATSFVPERELVSLRIPYDFHPSPEVYRRLAAGLAVHFGVASEEPAASDR